MGTVVDGAVAGPAGRSQAEPDVEELRVGYARETARLVRRRLELTVVLFLVFVGMAVWVELRAHPARTGPVLLAYALEGVACLIAVALCRLRVLEPHVVSVTVALAASLVVLMVGYDVMVGLEADVLAIGLVCLMTGLAVLLPWGWRPQAAVSLTALGAFGLATPFLPVDTTDSYPWIAVITGATTSAWGAFFLDRYRYEAFVRNALLAHASAVQREEAEISNALVEVGATLSEKMGRANVFEAVNRQMVRFLECDWSTIFFFDPQRQVFRFAANVGSREDVLNDLQYFEFPRFSLRLFDLFRPAELVEVGDAEKQSWVPPEMMRRFDVASALYAPIWRGEEIQGVLVSGYRERKGPFSSKQRRIALGIANATSTAIENERLLSDLQAANRLKSEFVSTMSHELRTPLNVITGFAEMLTDRETGDLNDEQRDLVRRIQGNAAQLLELINSTLDLGRLESGRDAADPEWFDVRQLFGEIAEAVGPLVQVGDVQLVWRKGDLDTETVYADRGKLKTILRNLVGNAIKFTPRGRIEITAARGRRKLVIQVRDTGIGIPPEHLGTIFDMFRQVERSSTSPFGGVGLGLYIVKLLVERLGGHVSVESRLGVGSTFTLEVPATFAAEARAQAS